MKFLSSYARAMMLLMGAMALYCVTVVPAIEPEQTERKPPPAFTRALGGERWWKDFFPEGAWQSVEPSIITTDRGILLSNSLKELDDKTWQLKPLTMILPHSREARLAIQEKRTEDIVLQDMWIVSANDGATIHFEEPLDLTSGKVPTVVRGELDGRIEVTRKVASEEDDKPWRIVTRDLTIDRRQLWTDHDVRIEWADSLIQGRALKVLLRSDVLGSKGSSSDSWGPLDELELYHVDTIDVGLPPGGIWKDIDSGRFEKDPKLLELPARIRATCGGRFAFDFKSSTASLQNGVQMRHQLGDFPADEFQCEAISFVVRPPEDDDEFAGGETQNGDPEAPGISGLQVRSLVATGIDSLGEFVGEKWVEIDAPTMDVKARCKQLKVDLERQHVVFSGRLDQPDAMQSGVVLNYEGNEIRSPRIEYQAAPEEPGKTKHLGWMIADGPGELRTSDASGFGETQVRWQQSLQMTPSNQSEMVQWIELLGETFVESREHGYLTSDRIEVWLRYQRDGTKPSVNQEDDSLSKRYQLERLFATGKTVLSSDQLRAEVPQLELTMVHVDPPQPTTPTPELKLNDSGGNPAHQWIHPPENGAQNAPPRTGTTSQWQVPGSRASPAGSSNPAGNSTPGLANSLVGSPPARQKPVAQPPGVPTQTVSALRVPAGQSNTEGPKSILPPEPLRVTGQKLVANVVASGKDSWIDHLQIEGPVHVSRPPVKRNAAAVGGSKLDSLPWHIEGSQLIMATNREGHADVQVSGQPAKVVVAEGALLGPVIRLDQMHNLVWMDHPGEFTVPLSVIQPKDESPQSAAGRSLSKVTWFKAPHCTWQRRMVFDGATIVVEGNVEFDAAFSNSPEQYWWVKGRSEQMRVEMSQFIDLKTDEDRQAEIKSIQFLQDVNILASETDREGVRKSREQLVVPSLTFNVLQNKLIGQGPGWLKSNYLGSSNKLGKLASSGESSGSELNGAHLKFRDSMVGFMDRNEIIFEGKVEVGQGPLASWDDALDLDRMQVLSTDQSILGCDQLKVYDTGGLSTVSSTTQTESWEFQATGNVAFNSKSESGDVSGKGYQVTYVQSKELLILRGDGRQAAELNRVPAPGTTIERPTVGEAKLYVESVALNPETLAIYDLKIGQGGLQFGMQQPTPSRGQPLPPMNQSPAAGPGQSPNPRHNFFNQPRR